MRTDHPQKNELAPHRKEYWVIPPAANAEFVCAMEDVLEVYQRPCDAKRPVVCVDETSKQLVGQVTPPVSTQPGQPAREDYEYVRHGTANLFMIAEPLRGWRAVKVTARRTKLDFAQVLRDLAEVHYPQAETIVLVTDNLNTHRLAVLYEAFSPVEARRLLKRFEVHHTPKHGSWLNMAEIELNVLGRQCLNRRLATQEELTGEVAAWQVRRNAEGGIIDWHFTTVDARIKLKRLYPSYQPG